MTDKNQVSGRLQISLGSRHQQLLDEIINTLQITKTEAVKRAIEGYNKIAKMQRKAEVERPPAG